MIRYRTIIPDWFPNYIAAEGYNEIVTISFVYLTISRYSSVTEPITDTLLFVYYYYHRNSGMI